MLKFFVCEIPTKGECGLKNNEITDITSKRRLFELNLGDVRKYRDLVMLFVKRDFKNSYKQTVLGPLWIIIKPFLSTFVFFLKNAFFKPQVRFLYFHRRFFWRE